MCSGRSSQLKSPVFNASNSLVSFMVMNSRRSEGRRVEKNLRSGGRLEEQQERKGISNKGQQLKRPAHQKDTITNEAVESET